MALTNLQQASLDGNGELLQRTTIGLMNYCANLAQMSLTDPVPTGVTASPQRVRDIAKGFMSNGQKYAQFAVIELVRLTTLAQKDADAVPGATPITFTQTQLDTQHFTETLIPDAVINGAMAGFFAVLINDPTFTAQ